MRKRNAIGISPSASELTAGAIYFVFQLTLLFRFLLWLNPQLGQPLSEAELNFVYYFFNFIAVLLIFPGFLGRSASEVRQHPAYFCQAVVLGLAAYYACTWAVDWAASRLVPSFTNYNDASILALGRSSRLLTLIGVVVLVPPVEECFFRGLIFATLYRKSHWAAYIVSMLAFTAIHITGYIGTYSAAELLIAIAQYLPAGLCLAWSYTKAETIFAPILIHAIINFVAISGLR